MSLVTAWWIVGVIAWLTLGILGYVLIKITSPNWTRGNRMYGIIFGLTTAPLFFVFGLINFIESNLDFSTPAKW